MMNATGTTASGGGVALRLFAALHVPGEHARRLARLSETIAARTAGARPTPVDELHVTYAFLGDVSEEYVPAVARALDAAAFKVPGATSCWLGEPVAMGDGRALTIEVSLDLLAVLDSARDAFLDSVLAYAPDVDRRAWHPHVTLLRTRSEGATARALASLRESAPTGSWVSPDLRLYASLPGPSRRLHKVLHSVPLGSPVSRA